MTKVDWDLVSWVRRGSMRARVLRLWRKPRTKSDVGESLGLRWNWVHQNMHALIDQGLVVELTSSRVHKGKIYGLTPFGEEAAKCV